MKINRFKNIGIYLIVALMLLSSANLTIDFHFCQSHIKSISLIGKAKSCFETKSSCSKAASSCAFKSKEEHKGCCQNKSLQIDADDDFNKISFESNSLDHHQSSLLIKSFNLVLHNPIDYVSEFVKLQIIPPLLNQELIILIQSFLL